MWHFLKQKSIHMDNLTQFGKVKQHCKPLGKMTSHHQEKNKARVIVVQTI